MRQRVNDIDIRRARPGDFAAVTSLLRGARLPVEDLGEERMADFIIASRGDSPAGAIGVEAFSHVGLLRSLVVDPESRAEGIGRLLASGLPEAAAQLGADYSALLKIADPAIRRIACYTRLQ